MSIFIKSLIAIVLSFAAAPSFAVEWDVSLWGKPRAFTQHIEKLAELVDERTGGEVKLNLVYGGLAKSNENLDGIAAGKFEMAQFCVGYNPEKNPSMTVLELPFLGITSLQHDRAVSRAFYKRPEVLADMARWNATLLMPTPMPQQNVAGSGPAPASVTDLESLRIRATGGTAMALETLGVETFFVTAPNVAKALENDEIDAVAFPPHAHMAFHSIDVANWWTANLDAGTTHCPIIVSTEALNSLSEEHRAVLLGSVDEALDYHVNQYETETMAQWESALQSHDIQRVEFAQSDVSMLLELAISDVVNTWIVEMDQYGVPAMDLFDHMINLIAANS